MLVGNPLKTLVAEELLLLPHHANLTTKAPKPLGPQPGLVGVSPKPNLAVEVLVKALGLMAERLRQLRRGPRGDFRDQADRCNTVDLMNASILGELAVS
jgi:hypothetical protein